MPGPRAGSAGRVNFLNLVPRDAESLEQCYVFGSRVASVERVEYLRTRSES